MTAAGTRNDDLIFHKPIESAVEIGHVNLPVAVLTERADRETSLDGVRHDPFAGVVSAKRPHQARAIVGEEVETDQRFLIVSPVDIASCDTTTKVVRVLSNGQGQTIRR